MNISILGFHKCTAKCLCVTLVACSVLAVEAKGDSCERYGATMT